ncbi:hypothetical protein EW145_g2819 [Phellinidium pouzarii]|uniref:Transcription factor CBF/NF-Y/archaeal histone domain-containing protein n=1 Tax=Phellinidium pouzarii TaxID=167371 RepID=A0A4S4L9X5_9AGAM|nr:hypothetical protein EW145_g2819 [Phellinidium pouzarii]
MKNKNKQTKFPVARIKKIMQKDEEVGKVAQATPVVISKALELFLGMLVDETTSVTLERNSKRVEAYHLYVPSAVSKKKNYTHTLSLSPPRLSIFPIFFKTLPRTPLPPYQPTSKHAVERTDMLDFLKEIVAGVPDPSAGGTIDIEAEKEARKRRAQLPPSAPLTRQKLTQRKKGAVKRGAKSKSEAGAGAEEEGGAGGSKRGWNAEGDAGDEGEDEGELEGEGEGEEGEGEGAGDDGGNEAYSDREQWD